MKGEVPADFAQVYYGAAAVLVGENKRNDVSTDEDDAKCPNCVEEADKLAERLVKMMKNEKTGKSEEQLKAIAMEIATTYCELQKPLSMDSCWAKAAFFSMAYMESGPCFSQLEEILNYKAAGLLDNFPSAFSSLYKDDENKKKAKAAELASIKNIDEKCKAIGKFVYGYNGNCLGNLTPDDGWTYRGRGLCQVTGRLAYTEVQKILRAIDFHQTPDSLEPFTIVDSDNVENIGKSYRLSTAISMAYFKYKGINMRRCDCMVKHDDIETGGPGNVDCLKSFEPVLKSMGNAVQYQKEESVDKNGNKTYPKTKKFNGVDVKLLNSHNAKKLIFKNYAYDAFDLKNCSCAGRFGQNNNVVTFHIYSNGHIVKFIPKINEDPEICRFVYHTHAGAYTIAERTIFKAKYYGNGEEVSTVNENDLTLFYTYSTELSVDGQNAMEHIKDGKRDYVIVFPKKTSNSKKKKYKVHKDKEDEEVELVRIDEVQGDQRTVNKDTQSGFLSFYKEDEVFISYKVDLTQTERCYSNPTFMAVTISMMAQYGAKKMAAVKAKYKDKFNNDPNDKRPVYDPEKYKGEFCRKGTGNCDIIGVGYPSNTHRNGMALDFSYGNVEDDAELIKWAKVYNFRMIYCGKDSNKRDGATYVNGHENHLHLGGLRDIKGNEWTPFDETPTIFFI